MDSVVDENAKNQHAAARAKFLYGPTDSIEGDVHIKKKHDTFDDCKAIANWLHDQLPNKPKIGLICGSGLSGLAAQIENKGSYSHLKFSTVAGHTGALICGELVGKPVIAMQGRFHTYEGYPPWKCAMPVRIMKLLSIEILIVTNAAGGLNPSFNVGDIMLIKDHINWPAFSGRGSLIGPNDDRFGPRFPAMSDAYDKELRSLTKKIATDLGFSDFFREGVYVMQSGPCYETIAECKMFLSMGADCTGMSTVPEVCVARHCDIKVVGMSLITNKCVVDYDDTRKANHEEVLKTGERRAKDMLMIIASLVGGLTV